MSTQRGEVNVAEAFLFNYSIIIFVVPIFKLPIFAISIELIPIIGISRLYGLCSRLTLVDVTFQCLSQFENTVFHHL